MSETIRVSEDALQYLRNRAKDGEDMPETVDRVLELNGETLQEEIRRIAREEAEEVVEEAKRGNF